MKYFRDNASGSLSDNSLVLLLKNPSIQTDSSLSNNSLYNQIDDFVFHDKQLDNNSLADISSVNTDDYNIINRDMEIQLTSSPSSNSQSSNNLSGFEVGEIVIPLNTNKVLPQVDTSSDNSSLSLGNNYEDNVYMRILGGEVTRNNLKGGFIRSGSPQQYFNCENIKQEGGFIRSGSPQNYFNCSNISDTLNKSSSES